MHSQCVLMFERPIRAVSGYFGNGARAFEIGKNSVVLDKIGKNFNKLKKISIIICNQGCIWKMDLMGQCPNNR